MRKKLKHSLVTFVALGVGTMSYAADTTISTATTSDLTISGASDNVYITGSGSITSATGTVSTIDVSPSSTYSGTIENNGTIESAIRINSSGAIKVDANSTGTITNNGTIEVNGAYGGYSGIYVTQDNNGTISNNGVIDTNTSSDSMGIRVDSNNNGTIINSANASITTESSAVVIGGANSGTIQNDGNITNATSNGIYINGDNNGTISNTGNISSKTNVISILGTNNGIIENNGTLSGYGGAAIEFAISVAGNTGTIISNSDTITSSEVKSFVVVVGSGGGNEGNITNTGTISLSAEFVYLNGNNTGIIKNEGNITAVTFVRDYLFNPGDNNGSIINTGTYSGNDFLDMDSTTNYGTIENNGSVTATSNGILLLANNGSIVNNSDINFSNAFNSIKITNSSSGSITNSAGATMRTKKIIAPGNTFTNSGTLDISNRTFGYNATVEVEDFTLESSGTLITSAMVSGSTVYSNYIYTTGDLVVEDNASIFYDIDSSYETLLAGQTIDLFVSDGNLTLGNDLNITDNSDMLTFIMNDIDDNGSQKTVTMSIESGSFEEKTVDGGENPYKSNGAALDTIKADSATYAAFNTNVIAQLNALSTDTEVAKAVAQMAPQTTISTATAVTQVAGSIANVVESRQSFTMGGMNSGDGLGLTDKNIWFKPFGGFGKQNNKDGINGFAMNNIGFGMGVDAKRAKNSRIGAALFYNSVSVSVNNTPQSSNMGVYTAMVYGNDNIKELDADLLYQASYSWQSTKSSRTIEFLGETASAKYTSTTAALDLKLAREYKVDEQWNVKPMLSATYRRLYTPSYTESGSSANLNVDSKLKHQYVLGVGAMAQYTHNKGNVINLNANLGFDLDHADTKVVASYADAANVAFDTNGIDNGLLVYELGVGTRLSDFEVGYLDLDYNFQGQGDAFMSHQVSAKYNYPF